MNAAWVLDWAKLADLNFLTDGDAEAIAASIGPVKAQLAEAAHGFVDNVEVRTRPAPN